MADQSETQFTSAACLDLTERMCREEEGAWREFHARFLDFLLAYAGSRGVAGGDAYDLVQATYLRVLRHMKRFREVGEFRAWLRCLLRCELIDQARKGKRRLALMEKYAHYQEAKAELPRSGGAGIDELLEPLPEEDQVLMMRATVEGWTHRDLAIEACSTPKAIESKLARLRKKLREEWRGNL